MRGLPTRLHTSLILRWHLSPFPRLSAEAIRSHVHGVTSRAPSEYAQPWRAP
jgi:hypothetical protein